jgi:hypothetical protein
VVRTARCGPRRHGSLDRPARLTNPGQVPEQSCALFTGERRRIETFERALEIAYGAPQIDHDPPRTCAHREGC